MITEYYFFLLNEKCYEYNNLYLTELKKQGMPLIIYVFIGCILYNKSPITKTAEQPDTRTTAVPHPGRPCLPA